MIAYAGEDVESGTLFHWCWECRLVQPLKGISFLKELKIKLPQDPSVLLLGVDRKDSFCKTEAIPSGHERAQLGKAWTSESPVLWYVDFWYNKEGKGCCPMLGPNCEFLDDS